MRGADLTKFPVSCGILRKNNNYTEMTIGMFQVLLI